MHGHGAIEQGARPRRSASRRRRSPRIAAAGLGAGDRARGPEGVSRLRRSEQHAVLQPGREGYEQKLAELLAGKLGKTVSYTYFPQVTGFVRKTLGAHKCDVIMGYAQGDELVQNTNAYYRRPTRWCSSRARDSTTSKSLADPG